MIRITFLSFAVSTAGWLVAQDNTILVYDVLTQQVETIPATSVPEPLSHFMPGNTGSLPGMVALPEVEAPVGFGGTALMRPPQAVDAYTLTDYPVRAAGGVREVGDVQTRHRCSAQLVAPRFVLTAAHCVRTYADVWIPGPLEFMPAFDQGVPSALPSSAVRRYYVPEQNNYDHALLELADPIGLEVGWVGLGFSAITDYFTDRIVHKFTYPGDTSFLDPSLIYDGDTLYTLSTIMERTVQGSMSYVGVTGWNGLPGESGGGVWVLHGTDYQVLGVTTFSNNYRHTLLDAGSYFQYRAIIESDVVGVDGPEAARPYAHLYPNPVSTRATLTLSGAPAALHELHILDLTGRTVRSISFSGAVCNIDRAGLAAGTYGYRVVTGNSAVAVGTLVFD